MTTPTAQRCQTCGEPADNELHDTSVYQSGYTVNGLFGTHAFVSPQEEEAPRPPMVKLKGDAVSDTSRFTEAALVKCGCNHFRGNHGTIFQEIAERSGACLVDGCSCLIYHRALGDTETPHAPTDECFDIDPAPHTFEEVVAMANRLAAPLDSGPREPTRKRKHDVSFFVRVLAEVHSLPEVKAAGHDVTLLGIAHLLNHFAERARIADEAATTPPGGPASEPKRCKVCDRPEDHPAHTWSGDNGDGERHWFVPPSQHGAHIAFEVDEIRRLKADLATQAASLAALRDEHERLLTLRIADANTLMAVQSSLAALRCAATAADIKLTLVEEAMAAWRYNGLPIGEAMERITDVFRRALTETQP